MVVLDTSIIIEHLRLQDTQKSSLFKIVKDFPQESLVISLISLQELYEGQSTKDKKKERLLLETLKPLMFLPYSSEIAKLAGVIARDFKNPIEFADAAIAATTIINRAKLATLNKKHFHTIPELIIF